MPAEVNVEQHAGEAAAPVRTADIVVGILLHESTEGLDAITRDAQDSLGTLFPANRCVIVQADGSSKGGAQEPAPPGAQEEESFVQISYTIYPAQKISPESFGVPGKANGVQAIFGVAAALNARVCAIIDATVGTPAPGSIASLIGPILEKQMDFVAPRYARHKYDGAILTGIVYPLIRALYSRRIHQPIGGDYAVSGSVLSYLLSQSWPSGEATSSDADAWVTIQTLCGGFRLAEASLGPRTLHPHEPAPDTRSVLAQALGSIFAEMDRSASFWQKTRGSQTIPMFGPHFDPPPDPAPVDPAPMVQSFRLGYQNLQDIYRLILPPATMVELKRMCLHMPDDFQFDNMLWARIVYDFALAWRTRAIDRDHLMGALTPLYLGWVASWVRAIRDDGPVEVQKRIEALCSTYEAQKSYLISRWRWPDRFNP